MLQNPFFTQLCDYLLGENNPNLKKTKLSQNMEDGAELK